MNNTRLPLAGRLQLSKMTLTTTRTNRLASLLDLLSAKSNVILQIKRRLLIKNVAYINRILLGVSELQFCTAVSYDK